MSRFEVDTEAVEAAAGQTQSSVVALGAEADILMRNLDQLQSVWRGQAATSFAALAADWRATHERVKEQLQAIQLALTTAGRQYGDVELSTVRMFAG